MNNILVKKNVLKENDLYMYKAFIEDSLTGLVNFNKYPCRFKHA